MPIRSNGTRLTRQELYDRMWSTPAKVLAKEFGLSDVGLAKTCARHKVPRPPRGYWAQLAFGKHPKKTPLPAVDDPELEVISFRQLYFEEPATKEEVPSEKLTLFVPDKLPSLHPVVAATRHSLKQNNPSENGILGPDLKTCLHVYVTKASVDRAMRICDTFVKYWESIGGTFLLGQRNYRDELETCAELGGYRAPFQLTEEVKRATVTPDRERPWNRYEYHATRRLCLEVDHYGDGLRRRWSDGSKQQLEDVLGSFVLGLQANIADIRLQELDRECVNRQSQRLEQIREEEQHRKTAEEARRTSVLKDVAAWRQANDIRAYLAEIHRRIQAGTVEAVNQGAFAEWSEWAWWFADVCDPLVTAEDRPASERLCTNVPVTELDVTRRTRAIITKLGIPDTDSLYKVTRKQLTEAWGDYTYSSWEEVCRVLDIHGYPANACAPMHHCRPVMAIPKSGTDAHLCWSWEALSVGRLSRILGKQLTHYEYECDHKCNRWGNDKDSIR